MIGTTLACGIYIDETGFWLALAIFVLIKPHTASGEFSRTTRRSRSSSQPYCAFLLSPSPNPRSYDRRARYSCTSPALDPALGSAQPPA